MSTTPTARSALSDTLARSPIRLPSLYSARNARSRTLSPYYQNAQALFRDTGQAAGPSLGPSEPHLVT